MGLANGVHHAAYCTRDIKSQIEFFSDVIGMELVALYWMHGVEGALHAFLKLGDTSALAFVQMSDVAEIEPVLGTTHAGNAGEAVAPGALQHMALNVETEADLLAMRDRIRSHGVQVFGPVDHGFCKSIYLAGPEGLLLEFATSASAIDAEAWIDPEVVALCGIEPEELARFKAPGETRSKGGATPQPAFDAAKPHQIFDARTSEWMQQASDEEYSAALSQTTPPVPGDSVAD